jgi:hypothetical protein
MPQIAPASSRTTQQRRAARAGAAAAAAARQQQHGAAGAQPSFLAARRRRRLRRRTRRGGRALASWRSDADTRAVLTERARQERGIREARTGSARRVAARKTRSGAGQATSTLALASRARFGEEAHGTWDDACDAELGLCSRRTFGEAFDAKMDAEADVLEELKNGRNSDKLANALSLQTALK